MCARTISLSCFVICNKFRVLCLSFISILVGSICVCPLPPSHMWKSKVSPWLLQGVLCPVWNNQTRIITFWNEWCFLSSFDVSLINLLSLFVLGSGTLGHLSTFSMIYVANKFSVLCLFAVLSCWLKPNLVYHWRCAGDSFCFYYAIICVFQWNVNPSTEDDVKNYPNK
jgi:hypothetical protein